MPNSTATQIKDQLNNLPRFSGQFYLLAAFYLVLTILLHWRLNVDVGILLYLSGSIIGLYIFDVCERFVFADQVRNQKTIKTSPFRSVFVQILIGVLTLFVLTSTTGVLGKGVVLLLNFRLLYLQYLEFKRGNLKVWFDQNSDTRRDTLYIWILFVICIVGTVFFIFL